MVVIVDYGMGNLRSVEKKFLRLGFPTIISGDRKVIEAASALILPGVGHFAQGMLNLKKMDLIGILEERVFENHVPIMGICLGMQLMTEYSEEGDVAGLGWIKGKTVRFNFTGLSDRLKIPHMGWNSITVPTATPSLLSISQEDLFYFVHSYYVSCNDPSDIIGITNYGIEFTSAFQRENILGFQFHPEKSHDAGNILIKNFLEINHV